MLPVQHDACMHDLGEWQCSHVKFLTGARVNSGEF